MNSCAGIRKIYKQFIPDNGRYPERVRLRLLHATVFQTHSTQHSPLKIPKEFLTGQAAHSTKIILRALVFLIAFIFLFQQAGFSDVYIHRRRGAFSDKEIEQDGRVSPSRLEEGQRQAEGRRKRAEDREKLMRELRRRAQSQVKSMPLKGPEDAGGKVVDEQAKKKEEAKGLLKDTAPAEKAGEIEEIRWEEIRPEEAATVGEKAVQMMVPFGPVFVTRNKKHEEETGVNVYDRIKMVADEIGGKVMDIKADEMPESLQPALKQLLEVEGVEVMVPGAEFAVAKSFGEVPGMKYDVKEEVFSIDKIILKKAENGNFTIHIPSDVRKDFEDKNLSLSSKKGKNGKTVEQNLIEGDVETLAMVLAERARYDACGFEFDDSTASRVAKAIIKVVGIRTKSPLVRLDSGEIAEVSLESEIIKIVGDDAEALEEILRSVYPQGPQKKKK
ncbi:MAG: hypothetical protein HQ594_02445 [Candidatus Omnitrophica bacterium]|nr:hypothetical protein [Candidatus Omnitrophota bacterium]